MVNPSPPKMAAAVTSRNFEGPTTLQIFKYQEHIEVSSHRHCRMSISTNERSLGLSQNEFVLPRSLRPQTAIDSYLQRRELRASASATTRRTLCAGDAVRLYRFDDS